MNIKKENNLIRSMARNLFSNFSALFLNYIFLFLISVALIRYLGPAKFGDYSFIIAYLGIFGFWSELGLSQLVTRDVSRDRNLAQTLFGSFILIQLLISICSYCLLVASINTMAIDPDVKLAVYVGGIGLIFAALSRPYEAILASFEKMHLNAMVNVVKNFSSSIMILAVILSKRGIVALAFVILLTNIISLVFFIPVCSRNCGKMRIKFDKAVLKKLFISALPFAFIIFATTVMNRIGIIFTTNMKGSLEVGWYSAAYKIIDVLLLVPSTMVFVIFPVLSRKFKESRDEGKKIFLFFLKYMFAIGFPVAIAITILAKKIVLLLFGAAFIPAIEALQILIWFIPCSYIAWVFYLVLLSIDRMKMLLWVNFILLAVSLLLNWWYINSFGYLGASIAATFIELLMAAAYVIYYSFSVSKLGFIKENLSAFLAASIMGIIIFIVRNSNLTVSIVAGMVGYILLLFLFGFFGRRERVVATELSAYLRHIFNIRKNESIIS